MDCSYSPHRAGGGTMHLPSPTHPHGYRVDGFPSIDRIRRSLSRSPSKPQRFSLHSNSPESPRSPISPLAIARAYSPRNHTGETRPLSFPAASPLGPQQQPPPSTVKKSKFTLRRTTPFRCSPRTRTGTSPRRALADSINQGNSAPTRSPPHELTQSKLSFALDKYETEPKMSVVRGGINDEPIKFPYARPRQDNLLPISDMSAPAKSSPLKRSDGIMNLDQASLGSPVAKRRSLHGASSFGADFNVFDHGPSADHSGASDHDKDPNNVFSSPAAGRASPLRKSLSLRKSTLQQRMVPNASRPAKSSDHEFAVPGPAASKQRNRMSLDSSLGFVSSSSPNPFRRSAQVDSQPIMSSQSFLARSTSSRQQPHPLSNALTPSSSTSSMADDSPTHAPAHAPAISHSNPYQPHRAPAEPLKSDGVFSRSLPVGAVRPKAPEQTKTEFATPAAYKMAKPLPAAFMSTGLISKRNRNVDATPGDTFVMPDTPSKRNSFPPVTSTPLRRSGMRASRPMPEFGTPSSPFSTYAPKGSPESFGKGVNIFGTTFVPSSSRRRASFASIDGEDLPASPSRNMASQSSTEDLPPTPTKPGNDRERKDNSLRSSMFGRRTSLGADAFNPPGDDEAPSPRPSKGKLSPLQAIVTRVDLPRIGSNRSSPKSSPSRLSPASATLSFARTRLFRRSQTLSSRPLPELFLTIPVSTIDKLNIAKKSPLSTVSPAITSESEHQSPHTPQDSSCVPPDPSTLSISNAPRRGSHFGSSTNSNPAFPPATPTAPRENYFFGSSAVPIHGLTKNEVDTALTSRFGTASKWGTGEFSEVYRVEKPLTNPFGSSTAAQSTVGKVWAVKKTKQPFLGPKDRDNKYREVRILQALRGKEHVIALTDSWEHKGHLYIQMDFCENGNLKDFLSQTGFKGRLDDFRIWKILRELSLGVQSIHDSGFIHLDIKPANVLIDWEGVLKIADFGLASVWPAPAHIDGEGDREYIAPEQLCGKFDKPADIFALGMVMLEIGGNCILPDNGTSWQRLRRGDMSDLPSLTWSSESSLPRDESGDPVAAFGIGVQDTFCDTMDDDDSFLPDVPKPQKVEERVTPPNFMIDPTDAEALDKIVQWMISPLPEDRPTIEQVYSSEGVQWVGARRRAGATIYEGAWGPADDVLDDNNADVDMLDV